MMPNKSSCITMMKYIVVLVSACVTTGEEVQNLVVKRGGMEGRMAEKEDRVPRLS